MERFVISGGQRLRCGFTTGTCAALAAAGAARLLLTGAAPQALSLVTPSGVEVAVPLEDCHMEGEKAVCAVKKDGGDDIDATHGLSIVACVERCETKGVCLLGGPGVGRVTKPGLDQPVGEWAINRVPRRMIEAAVLQEAECRGDEGGWIVTISVPGGEQVAARTFNPNLGIRGGISILGTSGIVEPRSVKALVDTIALELRQLAAGGAKAVILTPGNYGADFLSDTCLAPAGVPVVRISNFVGESLDAAVLEGYTQLLLVGHLGKLVKVAGGVMNTHSRWADCRCELICAHAALSGADQKTAQAIMDCATTDACLDILEEKGLLQPVIARMADAIQGHLSRRVGAGCKIGAVLFTNARGYLGMSKPAKEILDRWNKEQKESFTG